jgi:hypothetical protein
MSQVDVLKDKIITQLEINTAIGHYFKNIESLVDKFDFGCLHHEDYKNSIIKFKDDYSVYGHGFLDSETNRWEYSLTALIRWNTNCPCGEISAWGFCIEFGTKYWDELKSVLTQETISEQEFFKPKELSTKSDIHFISFPQFRKKTNSDDDPFPTFSQNCKRFPPFTG